MASFITSAIDAGNKSTYTFSGITFPAGRVVVMARVQAAPGVSWGSATINGVAASIDYDASVNSNNPTLYLSAVVSAGTGSVVLNMSGGSGNRASIGVWDVVGLSFQAGVQDSSANPCVLDINTNAGDVAIATVYLFGASSYSGSNLTERFDRTIEGSNRDAGYDNLNCTGGSPEAFGITQTGGSGAPFGSLVLYRAAGTTDALTADDAESASEVSAPNIGQEHALNATDIQSTSEVSAPAIGQVHALTAGDVESASEVTAPTIGQVHALTSGDVQSASEVSVPAIGQAHAFTGDDIEAASEVTNPALTDVGSGVHPLLADDIEASSETSSPAIGQVHVLTAESVESASEVTAPSVGQIHALAANDTEAPSGVSSPAIGQVHMLVATDIASASEVSSPVLTHVIAGPISHIILAGFRRPGYRAPGGQPSSQAPGGRGRARTVGGGA